MGRAFIPTVSMINALMKIATVNPQNAGPQTSPICSLVRWNAELSEDSTSPRMANTMDVVSRERQLVTNSFCLFISASLSSSSRQTIHHLGIVNISPETGRTSVPHTSNGGPLPQCRTGAPGLKWPVTPSWIIGPDVWGLPPLFLGLPPAPVRPLRRLRPSRLRDRSPPLRARHRVPSY